mgnify:CR=1 FL=1
MINNFPAKQNYTYLQTNRSDDLGSLWSTMNLDFQSNLGTMRVAPRLKKNTNSIDQANLGIPVAFKFFSSFHAICGTRIFVGGDSANDVFTPDTAASTQTTYSALSDLQMFNGILFSTTSNEIWSLDSAGGTWTRRGGAASLGNSSHMMAYFKKFNRLYVIGDATNIYSLNTAYTLVTSGDYALNLNSPNQQEVSICMKATSDSIWIGTGTYLNQTGRGKIYQWDGISAQVTNEYILNANACMAIIINNDIPYAIDSNGTLLKFTGSSFQEIGRLPNNNLVNQNYVANTSFIHPNGLLTTKNGTILALVRNTNNDSTTTIQENLPSGIWEWSEDFGFTHKHSASYNPVASSTIIDYGQNRVALTGALANGDTISDPSGTGTILAGINYYTDATTVVAGIMVDDSANTIQKKGYFVTTWFNSQQIEDKWARLWIVYRRFLASNDSIVLKYRLYEEEPIEATITWTSTTTFTTTTDVTAYGPTATGFNGTIGGEVEITRGTGGASCAHITNVVNNAGTYTVTLDTTITGATGTATARFQKWIKLLPEITGQVKSWEQMAIGMNNTRIQIKGCLTFTGDDEFQKFALVSNEDIKSNL